MSGYIPAEVKRQIRVECADRCALASCRQTPIEIDHIEDEAKGGKTEFGNLIGLCRNHHGDKTAGKVDRKMLLTLKANLSVINFRYGDLERRVLEQFAQDPSQSVIHLPSSVDLLMAYLVRDGYLVRYQFTPVIQIGGGDGQPGFVDGTQTYELTQEGREFVNHWMRCERLDDAHAGDP
jgi:hypothetical protein